MFPSVVTNLEQFVSTLYIYIYIHRYLPCCPSQVFSQEKTISEAVEGAFTSLYMKRSPSETALNLLMLTLDASIGDLASIEALVNKFTVKGDISHGTVWKTSSFTLIFVISICVSTENTSIMYSWHCTTDLCF